MLVEDFMIKSKYEINPKILESNKKYLDEGLLKTQEIASEIEDYSLTPKKSIVRQFFSFLSNTKPIEEITLSIPEKIKEKLQSFSITKGQSEKSTMECLNLELSKELFIKSQEGFYIDNYNKIAKSSNLKTEAPFAFYDNCEGISRFGINNHNTQEIAQSFNGALFSIIKINEDNISLTTDVSNISTNYIDIFFTTTNYANIWEQRIVKELIMNRLDIINSQINHFVKKTPLSKEDLFRKVSENINVFELTMDIFDKQMKKF
jgi:3D (Asp-Asp-Asp) domain-containing protein